MAELGEFYRAGFFVTLEGIEGAGKSTALPFVQRYCMDRGWSVEITREPGGGPLGEALRAIFLDPGLELSVEEELLLLYAGRHEHLRRKILPALQRGALVLCDRFEDSTFAYQGGGRAFPIERIQSLSRWTRLPRSPDLTLWFDVDPAIGAERIRARNPDRLERESLEFFERARRVYAARMAAEPRRYRRICANGTLAEVEQQLASVLAECLPSPAHA
ncbi:dTMP kinase [Acidithiobacillus caldus]|uniref:dTMP kinase n=1 Tax=Acidithiobacillus caldus TaxID=33059 RepID=UPI001C07186A|nr:dTMP kinase [Acidithiobacillus caldus]MBU2819910.1 dTMP kinase [Acidithiobacillus caldus]